MVAEQQICKKRQPVLLYVDLMDTSHQLSLTQLAQEHCAEYPTVVIVYLVLMRNVPTLSKDCISIETIGHILTSFIHCQLHMQIELPMPITQKQLAENQQIRRIS